MHVGNLFIILGGIGGLLGFVFFALSQWLIHKYMHDLDRFVGEGELDAPVYQNLIVRNLRMINYMGAAAWRFSNRRSLPDHDFTTLPLVMRRWLTVGFCLFVASCILMFGSIAMDSVLVDLGWVTVDRRIND